jgi:hypothetical protein
MRDDLYAALGVDATASTDAIAAAFRTRAKELHPDLHPGDALVAERFKRLTSAYRVLSRPASRAAYDSQRAAPRAAPPASPPKVVHEPVFRTPGRARAAIWFGVALALIGIAAGVVLASVPTGDSAKSITLWFVAAKFIICGGLLWGAGLWRLHRLRSP